MENHKLMKLRGEKTVNKVSQAIQVFELQPSDFLIFNFRELV